MNTADQTPQDPPVPSQLFKHVEVDPIPYFGDISTPDLSPMDSSHHSPDQTTASSPSNKEDSSPKVDEIVPQDDHVVQTSYLPKEFLLEHQHNANPFHTKQGAAYTCTLHALLSPVLCCQSLYNASNLPAIIPYHEWKKVATHQPVEARFLGHTMNLDWMFPVGVLSYDSPINYTFCMYLKALREIMLQQHKVDVFTGPSDPAHVIRSVFRLNEHWRDSVEVDIPPFAQNTDATHFHRLLQECKGTHARIYELYNFYLEISKSTSTEFVALIVLDHHTYLVRGVSEIDMKKRVKLFNPHGFNHADLKETDLADIYIVSVTRN